jgi:hypothetical protein
MPKGLHSANILITWEISKERNARMFNNKSSLPSTLLQKNQGREQKLDYDWGKTPSGDLKLIFLCSDSLFLVWPWPLYDYSFLPHHLKSMIINIDCR